MPPNVALTKRISSAGQFRTKKVEFADFKARISSAEHVGTKKIEFPEIKARSEAKPIKEEIDVTSNQYLLFRTKLDRQGKEIIFKAARGYTGFKKEISIYFPPSSVLGTENISLEIIPEDVIQIYNVTYGEIAQKKIVTPVLHVDRENGAPFLRPVTVTLPLVSDASKWISRDFGSSSGLKYSPKDSMITILTTKFSPSGVCYCDIRKVLVGVGLNDQFNLTYTEFGIYLIVEQYAIGENGNTLFKFDIRKFRHWQEHRRYRMDGTKFFCLLLNPEKVQPSDFNQAIEISVDSQLRIVNERKSEHVSDNRITFHFPDPEHRIDDSNERCVRLVKLHVPINYVGLRIRYRGENMRNMTSFNWCEVPFLTQTEIEDMNSSFELVNHGMLVRFLEILKNNWTMYLSQHLKLDVTGLHEFILQDIKASIPVRLYLPITDTVLLNLTMECRNKGYTDLILENDSVPSLIGSIFRNFSDELELTRAKQEIISILRNAGAIKDYESLPESLLRSSREVLAAAMMYINVKKLKESMRSIKVALKIPDAAFNDEMLDFFGLPEGTGLTD